MRLIKRVFDHYKRLTDAVLNRASARSARSITGTCRRRWKTAVDGPTATWPQVRRLRGNFGQKSRRSNYSLGSLQYAVVIYLSWLWRRRISAWQVRLQPISESCAHRQPCTGRGLPRYQGRFFESHRRQRLWHGSRLSKNRQRCGIAPRPLAIMR